MGSKEVLTFQLGNYANYVGAHWWNIQESCFEYDETKPSEVHHDVLFREGKTISGQVTFTPRLIMADKKGNSIHVPRILETTDFAQPKTWDSDKVATEFQNVKEKHKFVQDLELIESGEQVDTLKKDYAFDETVESWCDYSKVRYHPRSVYLVDDSVKTEVYHSGTDIYNTLEDEFVDGIRSYMEECDNLQGFQLIIDAVDGFGGLGSSVLLHLRDEYPSKPLLTFPVIPNHFQETNVKDNINRLINTFLSFQNLAENSTVLAPLCTNQTAWLEPGPAIEFPNLIYDHKLRYHSSAILASFLDTMSLRYRLRDSQETIHDLVTGLIFPSKKISAASMTLPFPMAPGSYLLETLENLCDDVPLWNCLTPQCDLGNSRIYYQDIVLRGLSHERLRNPEGPKLDSQAYTCETVKEMLQLFLSFRSSTVSHVSAPTTPVKTALPYPKIFSPHVSRFGSVDPNLTRADGFNVEHCPGLSGLHNCDGIGGMLKSLHKEVKRINIKRFPQFIDAGMDLDDYQECLESLLNLRLSYEENSDFI